MARSEKNLTSVFTDTASAIRAKTGTTETICPLDFADKINAIQTGGGGTGVVMKTFFETGGKCAYSDQASFIGIINYSDTENITDFSHMFFECRNLTELPLIDFTKGVSFTKMCQGCATLANRDIDITLPNGKYLDEMFRDCAVNQTLNSLKITAPITTIRVSILSIVARSHIKNVEFNIPSAENFMQLFDSNNYIESFISCPLKEYDASDGNNIKYKWAFSGAKNIKNVTIDIGSLNEESARKVDLVSAFDHTGLANNTVTLKINFLNGDKNINRDFGSAFVESYSIRELPAVNCTKAIGLDTAFRNCYSLEKLHFYNISSNIDISSCEKFDREGLLEVLNNLSPVTSTLTCTLGANNLAKLTDEDKAIATNKGWTLA